MHAGRESDETRIGLACVASISVKVSTPFLFLSSSSTSSQLLRGLKTKSTKTSTEKLATENRSFQYEMLSVKLALRH